MPVQRAGTLSSIPRSRSRMGMAVSALLVLTASCASDISVEGTERALAQTFRGAAPLPQNDTEERVFISLPTDFAPVRMGEEEFTKALVSLVLDVPLPVAASQRPVQEGRRILLASGPFTGGAWQSQLAQDYGRFCERRGAPGDCLNRFDDGPELDASDKRAIALTWAIGPALEQVDAEVRAMISPTRLLAAVSISITGYMALLVAPEPLSKGVATVATVLLWSYLGWEFWELIRAYVQFSEDSARATTFAQLREAGDRFGKVIGPNSVRILVLVGTAAIGGTFSLASRAPRLPGFGQAARAAELHGGVRVATAAAGAEGVIVSASEGTIRAVLPRHAMAMSARSGQSMIRSGKLLPTGHRAFKSFKAFKDAMGKAGEGKNWHHIVEQHATNLKRLGPEALHNTENVIRVDARVHTEISAFYSSKQDIAGGRVVREWLSTQSYEQQRAFGLKVLRQFGVIP